MKKLLFSALKELCLLLRDRSGLLVLFVMPALLVLVITLVQDNATKAVGETPVAVLLVDNDHTKISAALSEALSKSPGVILTTTLDGKQPDRQAARDAVTRGTFSLSLTIPEGTGATVTQKARDAARKALSMPTSEPKDQAAAQAPPSLELCFDPALPASFRSGVDNLFKLLLLSIETEERFTALGEVLPLAMEEKLSQALGPMAAGLASGLGETVVLSPDTAPLIGLSETDPVGGSGRIPNAVQQNVPAWSLFGVFFIVLPMAGSFIKERLYGLDHRLRVLPVSYLTIATGKVLAYVLVCGIQFGLMTAIGVWGLPLFGLPAFEVTAPGAGALTALCAVLAATGYGILLGTALRTYEQASVFGPISIVIASAMGGIMVPVWAMPDRLQDISRFSPLGWAQDAFTDLFVRGGSLYTISDNLLYLFAFAVACLLIAWGVEHRSKNS